MSFTLNRVVRRIALCKSGLADKTVAFPSFSWRVSAYHVFNVCLESQQFLGGCTSICTRATVFWQEESCPQSVKNQHIVYSIWDNVKVNSTRIQKPNRNGLLSYSAMCATASSWNIPTAERHLIFEQLTREITLEGNECRWDLLPRPWTDVLLSIFKGSLSFTIGVKGYI